MLNLEGDHEGRNGRVRFPAGSSVHRIVSFGITFATWSAIRGVADPTQADDALYEDYAASLRNLHRTKTYVENHLNGLADLALAGRRIEGVGLPDPPWLSRGTPGYVDGARQSRGENRREPLSQDVIAPLITWALRFVLDFSSDILTAKAERDRLRHLVPTRPPPGAPQRLRDFFTELQRSNSHVPSVIDGPSGKVCVAQTYIAARAQSSTDQVAYYLSREFNCLPIGQPVVLLQSPHGQLANVPWRGPILFEDVPRLCTLLHTAALIVVGYLTGMRPGELLTLVRGCCTRYAEADGRQVYALSGKHYKHVRADGIAVPEGRTRESPWFVVPPAAKAIKVVEQLHSDALLWPAKAPWSPGGAHVSGTAAMRPETASVRIVEFIKEVNRLALFHGRPHEVIPDSKRIPLGAFRRTLAWFIVWQPGGDVAAGLQYGHLEPLVTTQGYSGRSRSSSGLGDVIDMERLRRVIDGLADAVDRLEEGEGLSGPAAEVYLSRVRRFRETFGGRILTERQMGHLRSMTDLRIYESPAQYLTCVMDPVKALCLSGEQRATQTTPNLTRCSSQCPNGVRTDTHVVQMRDEAARLREAGLGEALPEPLRRRLAQRADGLDERAAEHDRRRKAEK